MNNPNKDNSASNYVSPKFEFIEESPEAAPAFFFGSEGWSGDH